MPSNATRLPGIASATKSVRRSGPPKQQFVVRPLPSIGQKSATVPSGSTTRMPCSIVRRDVEAAVGVEAEAVAAARAERLDHPFAAAVGVHALQAAALDDHDAAVGFERDAVAEEEAVGERAHATRRVRRSSPGRDAVVGRRVVAGIGEVDVAVGGDREIVRAVQAVVGEIRRPCRRARRVAARASAGPASGMIAEHAPGRLREVDAAVLGDEDRTVGRERGAVRAAAVSWRTISGRLSFGPHAVQRAGRRRSSRRRCRRRTTRDLRRTGCRSRRLRISCAEVCHAACLDIGIAGAWDSE